MTGVQTCGSSDLQDKFEGKPGIDEKTKELVYRSSKNIKWGSAAGHTFGGGAGM